MTRWWAQPVEPGGPMHHMPSSTLTIATTTTTIMTVGNNKTKNKQLCWAQPVEPGGPMHHLPSSTLTTTATTRTKTATATTTTTTAQNYTSILCIVPNSWTCEIWYHLLIWLEIVLATTEENAFSDHYCLASCPWTDKSWEAWFWIMERCICIVSIWFWFWRYILYLGKWMQEFPYPPWGFGCAFQIFWKMWGRGDKYLYKYWTDMDQMNYKDVTKFQKYFIKGDGQEANAWCDDVLSLRCATKIKREEIGRSHLHLIIVFRFANISFF